MDKDKQLQDEAINISHKQLSFFTPRHGYEPDSNIIQCMMNFAKSDIVKEYHNADKKYTESDLELAIDMAREGIRVTRISEWETEKEFDYTPYQIIESLNKKD